MEIAFSKYIWSFAGLVTLPFLLIGCVILHRRKKTSSTFALVCSVALAWLGQIIQMFAPFKHTTSYITDAMGNVTGATGTFPTLWYLGSILTSLAILAAAISFLWFSVVDKRS